MRMRMRMRMKITCSRSRLSLDFSTCVVNIIVNLKFSSPSPSTTSWKSTYILCLSIGTATLLLMKLLSCPVDNMFLDFEMVLIQWAILLANWPDVGIMPSGNVSFRFLLMTVGDASFQTPVIFILFWACVQRKLALPSAASVFCS